MDLSGERGMTTTDRPLEGGVAIVTGASRGPGRAIVVPTDVSAYAEVEALVRTTVDAFGRLDIVVKNSGSQRSRRSRRWHRKTGAPCST